MNELQSAVPHIYGQEHAHVFEEYVKPRLLILVHVRGYVNDQITRLKLSLASEVATLQKDDRQQK